MNGIEIQEFVEFAKWAMGGLAVGLGTAIALLFRLAFKLGGDAHEIKEGLRDLTEIKVAVQELPVIKVRLGTVEAAWGTLRSDIKHLLRHSNGAWKDGDE